MRGRLLTAICAGCFAVNLASQNLGFAQDGGSCRSGLPVATAMPACDDLINNGRASGSSLSTAYFVRSQLWRARNDPDHQLADLTDAIRVNPANAQALIARGNLLRSRKSYDLARADLEAAIATDDKSAEAYFQRAYLERELGENDRAFDDYTRSIQLNPNQTNALNNRGGILRDRKQFDESLADYDAAIRLSPNFAIAHLGRGRTLAEKKDTNGALAEFSVAIILNKDGADAYLQRADLRRGNGDRDGALADFNEALRINPTNAFALVNRSKVRRALNDIDGAIADLTRAIAVDPTYSSAFTFRGLAYEAKSDSEHAKADFTTAVAMSPKYQSGEWGYKTAKVRLATLVAPAPVASTPSAPASNARQPDILAKPATKSEKIALVIGNGAYVSVPKLPNPSADAKAVAASLRDLGFTVIEGTDLGRRDMEEKIVAFLRAVPGTKLAVVFYAGHGLQIDGRNYLVPIDAKSIMRATLSFELVDVDRVLSGLDDDARANVIILDACRDDPLESKSTGRSIAERGGLAAYSDVASGMLIAFSTSPGKTANDGNGKNSPFTTALLKYVKTPVEINEMLRQVRVDVFATTKKQQLPWANSSLLGQVYLSGK